MAEVNARGSSAEAVAAVACALVVAAGCGVVDTGVRVVDGGGGGGVSPSPESGGGDKDEAVSVDPVAVLREDPGVSPKVKEMVARPCSGEGYAEGWFPVYDTYTTIGGADVPVVIISVQGCADVVACSGVAASYVYRLWEDRTERVFATEEPMSEVTASDGRLSLQRPVWRPSDPSECPTGADMVPLRWDGDKLVADGE
ncbi:hypothetical protein HNR23_001690 [Nocardiopsis mwathae]|uniref:Lipoprotein n=1 Tax=Nocardiopsis mwathae TaxID=1472723 RepID=A0A7W9YGP4_9ACTN|nr:hypothetical protein [Nocardiopsis mwathae]MBB6171630.1 hypothetical protein [Nocardiopsis mwathae]